MRTRAAFTLIELVVVLVLISGALALVAPALIPRPAPEQPAIASLVQTARSAAIRRGETIILRIAPSGAWRIDGVSSPSAEPLAAGRVQPLARTDLEITASPLGTCAARDPSERASPPVVVDPLSCEVRAP